MTSPTSIATTDNRKSSAILKTPEAAAAPPATKATAAGMGKPTASAKTTAAIAMCPWRTTTEKKSFISGLVQYKENAVGGPLCVFQSTCRTLDGLLPLFVARNHKFRGPQEGAFNLTVR